MRKHKSSSGGYHIGQGRYRHKEQWSNGMAEHIEINEDSDSIQVVMPYDEDAKEALKEKFQARWDPDDKQWDISKARGYRIEEVEAEVKLHFPAAFR